jgi:hypothetical protein
MITIDLVNTAIAVVIKGEGVLGSVNSLHATLSGEVYSFPIGLRRSEGHKLVVIVKETWIMSHR